MDNKLTFKQEKFVHEYVKDGNGSRAAQEAYPEQSYESARVTASRLLTNANILDRIHDVMDESGLDYKYLASRLFTEIENPNAKSSDRLKGIRLAFEIHGIVGSGALSVNITEEQPLFNGITLEKIDQVTKKWLDGDEGEKNE